MKPAIRNILIGTLCLLAGTAWAQESGVTPRQRTVYEAALLDSAYRYELLKPTFFSLRSAYEYRSKEVTELRDALRLSGLQIEMQKQNLDAARRKAKQQAKARFWKGLRIGIGAGIAGGLLIGLKI